MIRRATPSDIQLLSGFACALWPDSDPQAHADSFHDHLPQKDCAVFIAFDEQQAVGFAQCQLRRDYVEGTDSSPVGYLEGIYVAPTFREKGHARALLRSCEVWAVSQGCTEFASDCELTNEDSLRFHLKTGFIEANRIICFTKKL